MPCSAVTLSLATISAIISVALLSIAFSTDNWLSYEVNRNSIMVSDPVVGLPRTRMLLLLPQAKPVPRYTYAHLPQLNVHL